MNMVNKKQPKNFDDILQTNVNRYILKTLHVEIFNFKSFLITQKAFLQ